MYKVSGKVKKAMFDHKLIWRHNGLMGQCRRAEMAMQAIYDAETTTDECKALAAKLEGQIKLLSNMLRKRRDQK